MPWCLQWVWAVGQVRLGCSPCDCPWFRAQLLRSSSLSPARNVALSVAVFGGRGLENPVAQHGFSLQTHPTPLLTLERDVCLLVLSPQKPQVPWAGGGSRSQPCIPLELSPSLWEQQQSELFRGGKVPARLPYGWSHGAAVWARYLFVRLGAVCVCVTPLSHQGQNLNNLDSCSGFSSGQWAGLRELQETEPSACLCRNHRRRWVENPGLPGPRGSSI